MGNKTFRKEEIENQIPEPTELFLAPTTIQWWAIVKIKDYALQESKCAANLLILNRANGPHVSPVFRANEEINFIYLLNQTNPSFSIWDELLLERHHRAIL